MDFLKAEQIGAARWRVLAIPFGGPFEGKDFDGEFFDRETDIKPRWFGGERPVVWHHDQDPLTHRKDRLRDEPDDSELGIQTDLTETPEGWWGTLWLDRSNRYWAEVDKMLRAGKAFGSSGAIAHMVRKNRKTGHIDQWPHAEQTITPIPSNFYAITASKALAGFKAAGITVPDDLLPDLSPEDGEAAAMKARVLNLAERHAARGRLLNL